MTRVLRVTRPDSKPLCAYAIFYKEKGQWVLIECAPILKKVLVGPIETMGKRITARGWQYTWANCVYEGDELEKMKKEVYYE